MTLFPSTRAGIYGAAAPLVPPVVLGPFDDPGTPTPGTQGTVVDSVTSNTVTAGVGDRIVLLFSHTRGTVGNPIYGLRSLSSIVGTGDFAGLNFNIATQVIASHAQVVDGNVSGARASIASLIVPSGLAGFGAFTVTWSGTAWTQVAQAFVLPPSSVVDAVAAGATNAGTSVALATSETLETDDLVFSILAHLEDDAFTVPSGFTQAANFSSNTNNRTKTAWKNGTLTSPFTWTGLSNVAPAAAAAAIFRRSAI
jgi:hypothetical protein